mgnify:CR=1 FL=1
MQLAAFIGLWGSALIAWRSHRSSTGRGNSSWRGRASRRSSPATACCSRRRADRRRDTTLARAPSDGRADPRSRDQLSARDVRARRGDSYLRRQNRVRRTRRGGGEADTAAGVVPRVDGSRGEGRRATGRMARDEPRRAERGRGGLRRAARQVAAGPADLSRDGHRRGDGRWCRGLLENKIVLVDPSGDVVFSYLKSHPVAGWEAEHHDARRWPSAGRGDQRRARRSRDLLRRRLPEYVRASARAAADLWIPPPTTGKRSKRVTSRCAVFRAIENGVPMVRGRRLRTVGRVRRAWGRVLSVTDLFSASVGRWLRRCRSAVHGRLYPRDRRPVRVALHRRRRDRSSHEPFMLALTKRFYVVRRRSSSSTPSGPRSSRRQLSKRAALRVGHPTPRDRSGGRSVRRRRTAGE